MVSLAISSPVIGTVIDGFTVVDEVGRGAHSIVYRVRRDEEEYALKLQHRSTPADGATQAFRREAAMLASLHHPGLVRIHEVGDTAGRPYLLMELLLGQTLRGALAGQPPWTESRAVAMAHDAAGALAAAHRAGLVHRDVKPENIFITTDGHNKVIDFGLAAHAGRRQDRDLAVGTALYSPPEQTGMLTRAVDGRSDLYALGVVLFETVAGRRPFESQDVGELIRQHAVQAPPDLHELNPDLTPAFIAMIERLLAKDPDDRYQSGEGLLADLDQLGTRTDASTNDGDRDDFTIGLSDDPAAVVYDLPLVGRGPEIDRLMGHWHRARRGLGGIALVEGGPGQGKSRLVRELVRQAKTDQALVLTGKAVAGSPIPMACLRDAVTGHLQGIEHLPTGPREEAERRLRRAAEDSGGMLATFSSELATLLGQGAGVAYGDDRQEQYFAAVGRFLLNLAVEHGGVLLGLDDAQWLDDASLRVLQAMSSDLTGVAMLVVTTARNDETSRTGTERFRTAVQEVLHPPIVLAPLDEVAVSDLISEQLGGRVTDAAFSRQLHTRCNGNPFAIVEYLRCVVDAGLVRPSWGSFVVDAAALDRLDLPADVIDLVLRRVDSLGEDALALLTAGAALGSRFTPGALGGVLDLDEGRLNGATADALRARLIERTTDNRCAFVHDCIREAMLDRLEPADCRRLHQALAESIEAGSIEAGSIRTGSIQTGSIRAGSIQGVDDAGPETVLALAHHYSLGEPGSPEKVYRWNEAAGRVALAAFAATDARQFFSDAALAAERAGIAVDASFEETFGVIMLRAGDAVAAHDHFVSALALTSEPWARAEIYFQLALTELNLFNAILSWQYVNSGLRAVGRELPRNPALLWLGSAKEGLIGIAGTISGRGFGEATGDEYEQIRTVARLYGCGGGACYIASRPIMTAALLLRTLPLVHRMGVCRELAQSSYSLCVLAGSVGLPRLVDRLADRALAVAEQLGDPQLVASAQVQRAYGHEMAGDSVLAAAIADDVLTNQSHWLDIHDLLSAVSAHPMSRDLRGLTAEARDIWMSAAERLRLSNRAGSSGNPYLFVGITVYAAAGRIAEAAHQLQLANDVMTDAADAGPYRTALLTERKLRYMLEMDELDDYDQLTAEADQLHLDPFTTNVYLKGILIWTAHAAVERLRRASPQERPARLVEARKRVRRERWYAREPIIRAHHTVHRAALAQIENHDGLALKLAAKAKVLAIRTEAPSIHFEVACVRARVAIGRGHRAEAVRQARVASQLARDYGWLCRARLLQREFSALGDLDTTTAAVHGQATSVTPSSSPTLLSTTTNGHEIRTRRDRSLDTLLALSMASAQVHDPDELAWIALDQLVAQLGAERAFLFLADDDGRLTRPIAGRNADGENLVDASDYASTVVERVRAERTALVVTGTDEGAAIGSESTVQHGLRSILAAPLMLEGRFLGVVYLDSRLAKGIFTTEDVDILAAISNHIAISIESARATRLELVVTSEREQRSLAETLRDSMTVVSATLEPVGVLERTLQMTARVIHFDRAAALLVRDGRWTLTAVAGDLRLDAPVVLPPDAHLASLTAGRDGTVGSYDAPVPHLMGQPGSWLSVPLVARGELIGVILMATDEPRALGPAQLELAATFAAQGIVAYENARLFEAVERLATTDELTSVNNRRQFFALGESAFVQARRYQRPLAAIMIDIDHFKRVNDNYGHAVGDDVIRIVSARLTAAVREVDIVGRYGGEEFSMILPETDEDVKVVGERLCDAVSSERISTDAGPLQVHISMGVATLTDSDASLTAILSRADAALYRAKAQGRNCVVLAD